MLGAAFLALNVLAPRPDICITGRQERRVVVLKRQLCVGGVGGLGTCQDEALALLAGMSIEALNRDGACTSQEASVGCRRGLHNREGNEWRVTSQSHLLHSKCFCKERIPRGEQHAPLSLKLAPHPATSALGAQLHL